MASQAFPSDTADYPIRIHSDDVTIGLSGDVIIAGPDAIRFRDLILAYPHFYRREIVPYLQRRVATFQPDDVWIDARWRIHITNKELIARAAKRATVARRAAKSRPGTAADRRQAEL